MSVEGRITVDALFHDKNGTATLKVSSMRSSVLCTSDVFACEFTVGTTSVTVDVFNPAPFCEYKNASGNRVSLSAVSRVVFSSDSGYGAVLSDSEIFSLFSKNNVAVSSEAAGGSQLSCYATYGTCTVKIIAME